MSEDTDYEIANVASVLKKGLKGIEDNLPCSADGEVEALTSAVDEGLKRVTAGLFAIANAITDLAGAIRERDE